MPQPMTTMVHYYWKEGNEIVVQNMVGGYTGQLHRHTPEDFERWKQKIKPGCLVDQDKEG